MTALEIQALKRINKGTTVLLLDKNGSGPSKNVAKELAKLGFGNVFIVMNGFNGWASSKLQIRQSVRDHSACLLLCQCTALLILCCVGCGGFLSTATRAHLGALFSVPVHFFSGAVW